ncbi:hypothetical protein ABL78_5105 [Leptomonas seymouri]|uniref:Uncharacterized protein n=1 Tax=Leptomonas seymouri TaxID=5684 RepID=A0A0N1PDS0_LEPSE|nr:hypothetical protein ABL78_5105 [Leptomonas seymouri]|eukprot:KPI85851.1 hypothetical protein ABL78_5105 [Leptomonas seymouri]
MPSLSPPAATSSGGAARHPDRKEGEDRERSVPAPVLTAESPHFTPSAPSTNGADVVNAAPQFPRQALTFEEFSQFYWELRNSDLTNPNRRDNSLNSNEHAAQREEEENLCRPLARPGASQGEFRRANDVNGLNGAAASVDSNPVDARQPPSLPPAQPPQQEQLGVLDRIGFALAVGVVWVIEQMMENLFGIIEIGFTAYVMYSQQTSYSRSLLMFIGITVVLSVLQAIAPTVRIGREAGTVTAPSFLGRLFKPEGPTTPVSRPRKVGYIIAKCAEAFLLSIFPTYSVEKLEVELEVDGIAR